jgi:hypothetical protein
MAYAKKNLPPGTNRPEIDDILRYPWEPKFLQNAKTEYFNLLTTERIFADEDPNKVIIIICSVFCTGSI